MRSFRCPMCNCYPMPSDLGEVWGATAEELASPYCKRCRVKPLSEAAKSWIPTVGMCYVEKLNGIRDENVLRCQIPRALRVACSTGGVEFVTDGERVWEWQAFPEKKFGVSFAEFTQLRKARWIGEVPSVKA